MSQVWSYLGFREFTNEKLAPACGVWYCTIGYQTNTWTHYIPWSSDDFKLPTDIEVHLSRLQKRVTTNDEC